MPKGNPGISKSLEHKIKISAALMGRKQTPEHAVKSRRAIIQVGIVHQWQIGHTPWNKGIHLSADHAAKARVANLGKKQTEEVKMKKNAAIRLTLSTPEARALRSKQAIERWQDPEYRSKALARRFPSSLEQALSLLLQDAEFEFETEKAFGRYTVDAWIPKYGLVFEADGYHHINPKRQKQDIKRDKLLLEHKSVRAVVHLTANDLTPWMEA